MNEEDVQGRERRTERVRDLETEDSSKVGGKGGNMKFQVHLLLPYWVHSGLYRFCQGLWPQNKPTIPKDPIYEPRGKKKKPLYIASFQNVFIDLPTLCRLLPAP